MCLVKFIDSRSPTQFKMAQFGKFLEEFAQTVDRRSVCTNRETARALIRFGLVEIDCELQSAVAGAVDRECSQDKVSVEFLTRIGGAVFVSVFVAAVRWKCLERTSN